MRSVKDNEGKSVLYEEHMFCGLIACASQSHESLRRGAAARAENSVHIVPPGWNHLATPLPMSSANAGAAPPIGHQLLLCSSVTGSKRSAAATDYSSSSSKLPKPAAEPRRPPPVGRQLIPLDAAKLLSPLSEHYHRLLEYEDKLDLTLERGRQELQSILAASSDSSSVTSCMPRPISRLVRIYISSHCTRAVPPDAGAPAQSGEACSWTVKVWAAPHVQAAAAAEGGVGSPGEVSIGEAAPLGKYFSSVKVVVDAPHEPVQVECLTPPDELPPPPPPAPPPPPSPPPADEAAKPAPSATPHCVVVSRTTPVPAEGLKVRVQLAMRKPSASGGINTAARVRVNGGLAKLLGMSPEMHVAYADVEEALWMYVPPCLPCPATSPPLLPPPSSLLPPPPLRPRAPARQLRPARTSPRHTSPLSPASPCR